LDWLPRGAHAARIPIPFKHSESDMTNIISKWKAQGGSSPPRAALPDIAWAWMGGALAIAVVAYGAVVTQMPLVIGSFGASCVLIFGFPDSPFSQPRNVIGGHVWASLVGLIFLHFVGSQWWCMALAAASGIAIMQLTRTVHPPAGSNPVIVMMLAPGWSFLLTPTLIGALLLVSVAIFFNNLRAGRSYPKYWY
jgi:CBS-domain-containing membrane protein